MTVEQKQIVHELLMSLNSNPICGLFTIDHTAKLLGLEDVAAFLHLTGLLLFCLLFLLLLLLLSILSVKPPTSQKYKE